MSVRRDLAIIWFWGKWVLNLLTLGYWWPGTGNLVCWNMVWKCFCKEVGFVWSWLVFWIDQRWVVDVCCVDRILAAGWSYIQRLNEITTENRRPLAASINHGTLNVDLVYKSYFQVEGIWWDGQLQRDVEENGYKIMATVLLSPSLMVYCICTYNFCTGTLRCMHLNLATNASYYAVVFVI